MPETKDDGGSAFPEIESDGQEWGASGKPYSNVYSYGGMSLRDYFAGQAMAKFLPQERNKMTDAELAKWVAEQAYVLADAMLGARKR